MSVHWTSFSLELFTNPTSFQFLIRPILRLVVREQKLFIWHNPYGSRHVCMDKLVLASLKESNDWHLTSWLSDWPIQLPIGWSLINQATNRPAQKSWSQIHATEHCLGTDNCLTIPSYYANRWYCNQNYEKVFKLCPEPRGSGTRTISLIFVLTRNLRLLQQSWYTFQSLGSFAK